MVHLDLAIDRHDYPALKKVFGAPGKRRILYVGHTDRYKNTPYLSEIAALVPEAEFAWIGHGSRSIRGVTTLGTVEFDSQAGKDLVAHFDFMLTVGKADANPTTILEAMAWGLIPICTPTSGYQGIPSIPNVPLDDAPAAAAILRHLLAADESELVAMQSENWRQLDEHYTWDRFAAQVIAAIESTDSPPLLHEPLKRRLAFTFCDLTSPYGRGGRLVSKVDRRWGRFRDSWAVGRRHKGVKGSVEASPPLTVCLDARLVSGQRGGVEQVIIGLASALSRLDDGNERYLFLVDSGHTAWLEPFISGPSSILMSAATTAAPVERIGLSAIARRVVNIAIPRGIRAAVRRRKPRPYILPESDGSIERAGVDVMHFTMQVGFRTDVPTIYTPHDLQHLHLPEFFSSADIAEREARYRTLCGRASIVTLMSTWGRDDIVARYGLPPDKVRVVPGAAAIEAYEPPTDKDLAATRHRLALPDRFALYPAKAWPHKNHLRLMAVLKILRDRGVEVPVVLTGAQGGREVAILAEADALGVRDLVHFVGFVTPSQLSALYRMARMMVFPSLFEGWGLPVLEAMVAGLPLACSTVTCLPAITAGAAESFDATDPEAIADAVARVWRDDQLRERLIADGRARSGSFSWDRSARIFRACYRMLGNRRLSAEDHALLDAGPLA
jgi:glycosyltransferase involved in cell wall biosynthesis